MNRLVIIGNGFDLAHGLPTSYGHFIKDFWKNFKNEHKSDEYQELISTNDAYDGYYSGYKLIKNFDDFKSNLSEYCKEYSYKYSDDKLVAFARPTTEIKAIFEFRSDFFKIINVKNSQNWVDIENEYYYQLKKIIKSESLDTSKSKEYWSKEQRIQVEKLNNEFEQVKNILERYLIKRVEEDYVFSKKLTQEFIDIFKFNEYKGMALDRFLMEVSRKGQAFLIDELDKSLNENRPVEGYSEIVDISHKITVDNYFLSFNYTSTVSEYIKQLGLTTINLNEIHGRLEDRKNIINFGFGDEMDDDYKAIENINDNEYLKNIKSFQYLHTSNYKKLLDLIDSDIFQVYIMGHSCGLSDRTLLNTIFEHENCCSIKVFYHEILNEQGEVIKDNYTEITQNISRHFNKKKLMREKIVNKTLCEALPQVKLPLFK